MSQIRKKKLKIICSGQDRVGPTKSSYIDFNHSYCNRCVCHSDFPFFFGGNAMGCKIFIRINTSKKHFFRNILSFSKLELRIKNDFRIMILLLRLSIINNEINMH